MKKVSLFCFLLLSSAAMASETLNEQKPKGIDDDKWSSLKMAVQEAKLLPEAAGIGGENSFFGQSVSVDGNRALVGAPGMAGSGAVLVWEFDGINWQQVAMLQVLGVDDYIEFGISVSLSGDRALIGAPYDNENGERSGAAYVFDFNGNNWIQSAKLTATDAEAYDYFGSSVSLSEDRALVGFHFDDSNGSDSGSAYVFEYNGNDWSKKAKLVASDVQDHQYFGVSVSLDGDRALVGATGDYGGSGSAYVFDYVGNSWTQTAKLKGRNGAVNDRFGYSVSLSGDLALVGAYGDDFNGNDSGLAYVFYSNGMAWDRKTTLIATDDAEEDYFGFSVNISGDYALVGAYGDDDKGSQSGSAYVFYFNGTNWSQKAKLKANDGAVEDYFAYSVGISGNRILVGAYGDDDNGIDSGSVHIFDYDGVNWNQSSKLTPGDGAAFDVFGYSVSLSGNRALVGSPFDDDNGDSSGSAYIFDYDGTNWSQSIKLVAIDGSEGDYFGRSVSLFGDRALVGANGDDNAGSAYIFDYDEESWHQSAKLTVSNSGGDDFGYSVSLSNDRALVGAYRDDDNGYDSGSVYVFDYDGLNWNQSAKLTANDGRRDDYFGYSVSLSGNRALVGAYLDDDMGDRSGSAYVFDYEGADWNQTTKLTASDGEAADWFGYSVSLSDDRALVSAPLDDDNGNNFGSVYLFNYDGVNWNQSAKLTANDGEPSDNFGISVSLSNDRALIGAKTNDNGYDSGSAYLFEYNGKNWNQSEKITTIDGALQDYFGQSVSLSGHLALVGANRNHGYGTRSGAAYIYNLETEFFVGGILEGLIPGNFLNLQNNGVDDLTLNTDGTFVFTEPLESLSTYEVTILNQPTNPSQFCRVINGEGQLNSRDVNDVSIICVADLIYRNGFENNRVINQLH
ncbi:MAG: hypothetical protein R3E90_00745 [Marinicella sp.]